MIIDRNIKAILKNLRHSEYNGTVSSKDVENVNAAYQDHNTQKALQSATVGISKNTVKTAPTVPSAISNAAASALSSSRSSVMKSPPTKRLSIPTDENPNSTISPAPVYPSAYFGDNDV